MMLGPAARKTLLYSLFALLWTLMLCMKLEITNLKCLNLDPSYVEIEVCKIKVVNRTYKHVTIHVRIFEIINNVTANIKVMKRANGYKPFLYDITVDACKFMRLKNKNPVVDYLYAFFRDYSNMNHTCPYSGMLIVEKIPVTHLSNQMTKILPFPPGEFAFYWLWSAYGKPRADIRIYVTLRE